MVVIGLGLMLGSWASGVGGGFLSSTRPYRKARNPLVIGLGYIVIGLSSGGTLLLFLTVLARMHIPSGTPQEKAGLWAYTISFATVGILAIQSEMRWQKSIGLRR